MAGTVGSAFFLGRCHEEIFVERGIITTLLFLLCLEWITFATCYDYSKPEGVDVLNSELPKERKVKVISGNVVALIGMFVLMFVSMFTKPGIWAERFVWISCVFYLIVVSFQPLIFLKIFFYYCRRPRAFICYLKM